MLWSNVEEPEGGEIEDHPCQESEQDGSGRSICQVDRDMVKLVTTGISHIEWDQNSQWVIETTSSSSIEVVFNISLSIEVVFNLSIHICFDLVPYA